MRLNLFSKRRSSSGIDQKPMCAPLLLEHLEDRSVPSTFTVNTTLDDVTPANGKFSLREAITKANTTPEADVIVVPAGVFKITISGTNESNNNTGDFDIKRPFDHSRGWIGPHHYRRPATRSSFRHPWYRTQLDRSRD